MKIVIGATAQGKNVAFDLDTLITTRLLIQANSGAGKSYLLRKLIEALFGHAQIIMIDPEGEFATLREKYDFILAGPGGETPTDARTAEQLAIKLLELRVSAVCDLYEMKAADRHEWVAKFLSSLVDAPKKLWHRAVIIVDEAQMFCPEKSAGESKASGPMIDLTTRGRKRGFCAVWATQRLANVNKDATSMLLNRLVGGTFEDVDIKRALNLLSVASEDKNKVSMELKTLDPGWFYAFGRAISKERLLFKVGKVETSHPQPGSAKHAAAPPPPPDKVKALLPQLADLPQEAEQKAVTLADFKRRVSELQRQLRQQPKAAPVSQPSKQAEFLALQKHHAELLKVVDELMKITYKFTAIGFDQGTLDPSELKTLFNQVAANVARLTEKKVKQRAAEIQKLKAEAVRLQQKLDQFIKAAGKKADKGIALDITLHAKPPSPPPVREPVRREPRESNGNDNHDKSLSSGAKALVAAMLTYPDGLTRTQARGLCGFASRTLDNKISELRAAGLITSEGGKLTIPPDNAEYALKIAGDITPPASTEEVLALWTPKLSGGAVNVLNILVEASGAPVEKSHIMEQARLAPRTLDNKISELSNAGLISKPGPGVLAANTDALLL